MSTEPKPLVHSLSDSEFSELWQRFGERLRLIARKFLGAGRRLEDSEGIANAAFFSLVKKISNEDGDASSYSKDDLWPIALTIAKNKALMANRSNDALKRGGDAKTAQAETMADGLSFEPILFAQLDELMQRLDQYTATTPLVRQIVERRLAGHTSKMIAEDLQVSEATVSRRLTELKRFLEEC